MLITDDMFSAKTPSAFGIISGIRDSETGDQLMTTGVGVIGLGAR